MGCVLFRSDHVTDEFCEPGITFTLVLVNLVSLGTQISSDMITTKTHKHER